MKKIYYAAFAALIAFNAVPTEARSQVICGDRSEIVKRLQSGYEEKPVSLGIASNGSMVEVFASENGTFSILTTRPGGNSCLVAAGDNWQNAPLQKAGAKI